MIFSSPESYMLLMAVYAVLVVSIVFIIDRSKFGLYLKAIREEENAATSLGINSTAYKMLALIISAVLTGIGGSLFVQYTLLTEPASVFNLNFSIMLALIAIIGGLGTVFGPVIGALIIIPISEWLQAYLGSSFPGLHLVIYGTILIIVIRWLPQGIYPAIKDWLAKKKSKNLKENSEWTVSLK